jgi:hypothetical protein
MFRHVWDFFVAVIRQWGALLTGGVVVAVIGVYEHAGQKSISGWPFWSAVNAALFIACFLAWRKERVRVESFSTNLLSLTPEDLVGAFTGRTTPQGQDLCADYIGKWMEVSGPIQDIYNYDGFLTSMFYPSRTVAMVALRPSIFLVFRRRWIRRLSALHPGENITVFGRVRSIESYVLRLDRCELRAVTRTTEDAAPP